jgi:alpha-tubulin suppressor-like RCC1 family protein
MGSLIHRARKGVSAAALASLLAAASPARADVAYAWGNNNFGEVGDGTITNRISPVAVNTLTSGVTAVAAGQYHSLAIQSGGVYSWGYNNQGQLGDGTATDRSTPVAVNTLITGVTAIAGGQYHSLAIQNSGVYAWGYNGDGELGDGTTTNHSTPLVISTLSTGVTAIAAGQFHSLAIQNGGVYAWGENIFGQLGDGTTTHRTTPVALTGTLSTGVTAIAGGEIHSLAIQMGGVYAWGNNDDGQLGDGTTTTRLTPVALSTLTSGVTAISAGVGHSLAIQNGNVYAWGDNTNGQLGDGSLSAHNTPEEIDPTDLHNIIAIAAGADSSYALSSDGTIWDWGANNIGQLGIGNTNTTTVTPQHVLPATGYIFTSIAANDDGDHAVATEAPVPEPTSLSLLALAGIAILRRTRKAE